MSDLSLHGKLQGIDLRPIEHDQAPIDYGDAPIWLSEMRATQRSSALQDSAYAGTHILVPAHAAKVKCDSCQAAARPGYRVSKRSPLVKWPALLALTQTEICM